MSGTTTSTQAARRDQISTYAPLAISIITLLLFGLAYLIAYRANDTNTLLLFGGAIIAMAKDAVSYWINSTASSKVKDDRQADLVQQQTAALATSGPLQAPTTQGPTP